MKWVTDTTGQFGWRPYYEQEELDRECERIVADFMVGKYGAVQFPFSTDDLAILVERDTSDLDLFADLSTEGDDVEGTTDFFPHKKPVVKIAKELSLESSQSMRLRTTLAHEYGHVKFHNFLWDMSFSQQPSHNLMGEIASQRKRTTQLRKKWDTEFSRQQSDKEWKGILALIASQKALKCSRGLIFQAPVSNWMEWQASYVCGAILMPLTAVHGLIRNSLSGRSLCTRISTESAQAGELIQQVAGVFDVSDDAARVRLIKMGILQ